MSGTVSTGARWVVEASNSTFTIATSDREAPHVAIYLGDNPDDLGRPSWSLDLDEAAELGRALTDAALQAALFMAEGHVTP